MNTWNPGGINYQINGKENSSRNSLRIFLAKNFHEATQHYCKTLRKLVPLTLLDLCV